MSNQDLATIFKAYDIRGTVGEQLTPDFTYKVGRALADYLPVLGSVAVGYDMRPDSAALAQALRDGLTKQGRPVIDIGRVTSDMIYFAVGKFGLAGGAVVTASHNPGKDNGLKIYRDGVRAVGLASGLAQIRDAVLAENFKPAATTAGTMIARDITKEWVEHCLTFVTTPLKPFRIAIDAGNGMAGAILPHILPKLGLDVKEMYFEPDGTFPNHEANPQKLENLQDLIETVKRDQLDFGLAFDGDGDRAVLVADLGRSVSGSDFIALAAKHYLKLHPGATIVHEVRTSRAARELISEWGGQPFRVKAGRIYIGEAMRERDAPFGGETSGHLFFKDNYFADSGLIGALVAMVALSESGERLSTLIDTYHRYLMIPEMNLKVADAVDVLTRLAEHFQDGIQDRLDGLTVNYPDWWFNLRVSNTEPVVRLNLEANDQALLEAKTSEVVGIIKEEK
ncbi:MAG: phosphomannomutase/phosphoglucomutase [Patescibacteria group bacterium]